VSLVGRRFALLHPRGPRSSPLTCNVITLKPSRREKRGSQKFQVLLSNGQEPMLAELASTENVSSYGARTRTELAWRPNARIFLKSPKGKFWTRARVVYCRALQAKTHALGLEFYATAHRYNLTFRCINASTVEVMKHPPTIAATGFCAQTNSKRKFIEFIVHRAVGRAKLSAFPRFMYCTTRAKRVSVMPGPS